MKRRSLLAGGATLVVVAGGVWRAVSEGVFSAGEGPAYEPWSAWRQDMQQGPLALVRAAILAANPHNTQPWLFDVGADSISLYADTARHLGAFDPCLREMHLGLGCALENMLVAARVQGLRSELQLEEGRLDEAAALKGTRQQVARLRLAPAAPSEEPLAQAIPQRHTHRGAYDPTRALSPETLAEFARLCDDLPDVRVVLFTAAEQRTAFAAAVVAATESIIADAAMVRASDAWFRSSWEQLQRERDGLTLDASGVAPWLTVLGKLMPAPSARTNHAFWLDATRKVQVATAPAFGLVAVRDLYDRAQTLRAGRAWQRLHLWATTQGIAMQPLNQPIEMVDRERQLGREPSTARMLAGFTGDPSWQPTFAFRAGYAARPAPASPRRAAERVLIRGGGSPEIPNK